MLKIYYDTRTTGCKPWKHSLIRVAGLIEKEGHIVEKFDIWSAPHPKAQIDKGTLELQNMIEEDLLFLPSMEQAHAEFCEILTKYISKFDKDDKAFLVGYNNRAFDDIFLRTWFELCGDVYMGSWFWPDTRDVMVLASEHLENMRTEMPDFSMKTVAKTLGLKINEDFLLPNALYSCEILRKIYKIVTNPLL